MKTPRFPFGSFELKSFWIFNGWKRNVFFVNCRECSFNWHCVRNVFYFPNLYKGKKTKKKTFHVKQTQCSPRPRDSRTKKRF